MHDAGAIARLRAFATLDESDFQQLVALAGPSRIIDRGEYLRHEGDSPPGLYLLIKGWMASTLTFNDGARQMLKVNLPGDMLGAPSLAFSAATDSLLALSEAEVKPVPLRMFGDIFRHSAKLASLIFLVSLEERVMIMDRLASIGRTHTAERVAALMLHLHDRLIRTDPTIGTEFDVHLTQHDVADLVGVTTVHVNRTLQKLRTQRVLDWRYGRVKIMNREALVELAGLPPRHLSDDVSWLPINDHRPTHPGSWR